MALCSCFFPHSVMTTSRLFHEEVSVAVTTEVGQAAYRRSADGSIELEYSYVAPEHTVSMERQDDLAAGIRAQCIWEVNRMREALTGFQDALRSKLPTYGPSVRFSGPPHESRDSRTWQDRGTQLQVDASENKTVSQITLYEHVADGNIVAASIDGVIRSRELQIRDLYWQMLIDVSAKRRERAAADGEAKQAEWES